tara:strand:+ start:15797 stop:16993 length:1197 start_codon:yes stop_codon:yes gene_type:complete
MLKTDVIVIGAGAAGLMCAIEAAKKGRKVVILEHSNKPGKKILMSGGGRCNFTNYYASPENYLSSNPHFCKSALSQYTQWDFIALVEKYSIEYYEKTLGQLFCKNKSKDILNMLLSECDKFNVELKTHTEVLDVEFIKNNHFIISTETNKYHVESLVIATGGLSIPTMGASPFGYKIAKQFDLDVLPTAAGLVPFTLTDKQKTKYAKLSGIAVNAEVTCNNRSFKEGLLFTHRGLSGPSILQISSYWKPGDEVFIDILPDVDLLEILETHKQSYPEKLLKTVLSQYLPKSVVKYFLDFELDHLNLNDVCLKQLNSQNLTIIEQLFKNWVIKPAGTEGYRTAEVTLGGVDVNQVSSKTMETNSIKGLYFIGEVLDVTGWLGGYNFQWAWSSGFVAGQNV